MDIQAKIVVVGDGAIGKTCLMIRYTQNYFETDYAPTIFQNINKTVQINNLTVNLSLWDTAGQQQYSRLRPVAYPNTDVFVIAFSVVEPSSFVNAKKWYPQVKNAVPNCKVVFAGTKTDLRSSQNMAHSQLTQTQISKNLRQELGCEYRECSAMTGEGIQEVFRMATETALVKLGHVSQSKSVSSSRQSISSRKLPPSSEEEGRHPREGCYCTLM